MVLTKKVTEFILSNQLISPNDHIIVALSGGRDSISLLHVLNSAKSDLNISLSAVHINHGIRGLESDKDEEFVKKECEKLGISCSSYRLSGFKKSSGENALRKERYKKYEEEIRKFKNCKLATGHHSDDQLETYLMRLFKGSGPKGLLGIPVTRDKYIRPLLSTTRNEIDHFCNEKNISFRDDSSNFEQDKLRSKIRNQLTPALQQVFGADYLDYFSKSHEKFAQFYGESFKLNFDHFEKISKKKKKQIIINKYDYLSFAKFQKWQFLEYCFSYLYGLSFTLASDQMIEFEKFVTSSKTGSGFEFTEKQKVIIDRSQLIFFVPIKSKSNVWELYAEQSVNCDFHKISIKEVGFREVEKSKNNQLEFISGDNLQFPLNIRYWENGDFFHPLGCKGKQKLSDFFVNEKVSVLEKKKTPLVLTGDNIIWVAGYRISELYKITKKSKTVYKIEIEML